MTQQEKQEKIAELEEAKEQAKKIKLQIEYKIWCEERSEPINWHNTETKNFLHNTIRQ